jgi:hypothetical protein
MQQPDRHEAALQVGHRLAGLERVQSEVIERDATHLQDPLQLGNGIRAVVPQSGPGLRGIDRTRVVVGDVALARGDRGACLG